MGAGAREGRSSAHLHAAQLRVAELERARLAGLLLPEMAQRVEQGAEEQHERVYRHPRN